MNATCHPLADNETYRLQVLRDLEAIDAAASSEFDRIAISAKEEFGVSAAILALVDEDIVRFAAAAGTSLEQVNREDAFCAYTVLSDAIFVVLDAAAHPIFKDGKLVGDPFNIRFYAGAPLVIDRAVIGALCLIDPMPRATFGLDERARLTAFADEAVDQLIAGRQANSLAAAQNARKLRMSFA